MFCLIWTLGIGEVFKYIDALGAWHHEVTEVVTQLSSLVDGMVCKLEMQSPGVILKWIGSRAKDGASVFALGYQVALVG